MDPGSIGCSLAEAAESPAYDSYLAQAAQTPNSLHVSAGGGGWRGRTAGWPGACLAGTARGACRYPSQPRGFLP